MTTRRRPRISRRARAISDLALGILGTVYVIVQVVRIVADPGEFFPWVAAYFGLATACLWYYRFGEYRKALRREAEARGAEPSQQAAATPEPEN